jgi:N-myristoyl transferase
MTLEDVPRVSTILQEYTKDFRIAPVIDEEYVKQWVLPIHSYVADGMDAFISFYDVAFNRVDGSDGVRQAYRFYMVGDVYNDAFLIAQNLGYDVFNTPDIGVDTDKLEKLKFMKGRDTYTIIYSTGT